MLSGRRLDILDPSPFDIELDDIAHGIARVARWNGQTAGPHVVSVAQHSCLVEAILNEIAPATDRTARLTALLHDAPEYVIGDAITPLKSALGEAYASIERRLLVAIHLAFGLPPEPAPDLARLIKRADRIAAWLEATRLAGFTQQEALAVFGPPEIVPTTLDAFLTGWPPELAEMRFRERVDRCMRTQQAGHETLP